MNSRTKRLQGLLEDWLRGTQLFPSKTLMVELILNPQAGALCHRRRAQELIAILERLKDQLPPPYSLQRKVEVTSWTTEYEGHEKEILSHLHAMTAQEQEDSIRLVVVAGGDGTSRGVLISALDLEPDILAGLHFFRLPLGTGNDAAETKDWLTALGVLSGRSNFEVRIEPLPVLEVVAAGQRPHYSFNIASVGLDAFVVDLTNKMKRWFPGDSYSLMVDVAAFFYEFFVKVVPATLELVQNGRTVLLWQDRFLLAAMGTTGNKTYGAGKRVLPDHDNFCLAGKRNLFSKLAYRKPFYLGTHRGLEGITLASGDFLRVESPVRVPLQMDGEVLWLDSTGFPLTMSIKDRGLKILALASSI